MCNYQDRSATRLVKKGRMRNPGIAQKDGSRLRCVLAQRRIHGGSRQVTCERRFWPIWMRSKGCRAKVRLLVVVQADCAEIDVEHFRRLAVRDVGPDDVNVAQGGRGPVPPAAAGDRGWSRGPR